MTRLADEAGVPLAIIRLSGIYGPGRNALRTMHEGKARRLIKPGQVFNRIHNADIGGATALLARQRLGGIFNVTDDLPAPPQDVVSEAARLMGVEPPAETGFIVDGDCGACSIARRIIIRPSDVAIIIFIVVVAARVLVFFLLVCTIYDDV